MSDAKYSKAMISYVRIMRERLIKAIKENDQFMMNHVVESLAFMEEKMNLENGVDAK